MENVKYASGKVKTRKNIMDRMFNTTPRIKYLLNTPHGSTLAQAIRETRRGEKDTDAQRELSDVIMKFEEGQAKSFSQAELEQTDLYPFFLHHGKDDCAGYLARVGAARQAPRSQCKPRQQRRQRRKEQPAVEAAQRAYAHR